MNCSGIRHVLETKFGGKFDSDIIIQDIYFISNTDIYCKQNTSIMPQKTKADK